MSSAPEPDPGSAGGAKAGLAAFGVVAFAVACCAGGPLLVAVAGGIALGTVLGIGVGAVALVGLVALVVVRTRRRRACAPRPPAAFTEAEHEH